MVGYRLLPRSLNLSLILTLLEHGSCSVTGCRTAARPLLYRSITRTGPGPGPDREQVSADALHCKEANASVMGAGPGGILLSPVMNKIRKL